MVLLQEPSEDGAAVDGCDKALDLFDAIGGAQQRCIASMNNHQIPAAEDGKQVIVLAHGAAVCGVEELREAMADVARHIKGGAPAQRQW